MLIQKTEFFKASRYWIAVTSWSDTRSKEEFKLLTGRSYQKVLITELNGQTIISHNINSASRVNVEKHHKRAINEVFEKIIKAFDDKNPTDLKSQWQSIAGYEIEIDKTIIS